MEAIKSCNYTGGNDGEFWVLDPIDGTKGFIRGGQYAIGLSYVVDAEPIIGVIGCPNLPLVGIERVNDVEKGTLFYSLKSNCCMMCQLDDIGNPIDLT